jgi:hypothetical protein
MKDVFDYYTSKQITNLSEDRSVLTSVNSDIPQGRVLDHCTKEAQESSIICADAYEAGESTMRDLVFSFTNKRSF